MAGTAAHPMRRTWKLIALVWLMLLFILVAILVATGDSSQRYRASEVQVVPPVGYQTVISPIAVDITEVLVSDRTRVSKGDPLVAFMTPTPPLLSAPPPITDHADTAQDARLRDLLEQELMRLDEAQIGAVDRLDVQVYPELTALRELKQQTLDQLDRLMRSIRSAETELKTVRALVASGDLPRVEADRIQARIDRLKSERQTALETYRKAVDTRLATLLAAPAASAEPLPRPTAVAQTQYLYSPYSGVLYFMRPLTSGTRLEQNQPFIQITSFEDRELGIGLSLDATLVERLTLLSELKLFLGTADNKQKFELAVVIEQIDPLGVNVRDAGQRHIVARAFDIPVALLKLVADQGPQGRYSAEIEIDARFSDILGALIR